jgi:hypothetical protein
MHDFVETALNVWGRWLLTGNQTGLGYPECGIAKLMRHGLDKGQSNWTADNDILAERVENAVVKLAEYRPNAARALRIYYQTESQTLKQAAKRMKTGQESFRRYIEQGKMFLSGALN